MPNIPVECLACGKQFQSDHNYMVHLQTVHGTDSPDQAMNTARAVEMNTPGPQVIGEGIPPSPEMLEVMQQAEQELATRSQDVDNEPVGEKRLSDSDIQKLREMGVPEEVPKESTKPKKESKTAPDEKVELQPIELTYKYVGNHKCGSEVETLMVKAKGELFSIAYCPGCKKQVKSLKVAKIDTNDILYDKE